MNGASEVLELCNFSPICLFQCTVLLPLFYAAVIFSQHFVTVVFGNVESASVSDVRYGRGSYSGYQL